MQRHDGLESRSEHYACRLLSEPQVGYENRIWLMKMRIEYPENENRIWLMESNRLRKATFINNGNSSNFVIDKNLLAFLYGLDRNYENLVVNGHEFRVAQFPAVGVCKPAQKMTANKPFQ